MCVVLNVSVVRKMKKFITNVERLRTPKGKEDISNLPDINKMTDRGKIKEGKRREYEENLRFRLRKGKKYVLFNRSSVITEGPGTDCKYGSPKVEDNIHRKILKKFSDRMNIIDRS